jgi:hypothetical protein
VRLARLPALIFARGFAQPRWRRDLSYRIHQFTSCRAVSPAQFASNQRQARRVLLPAPKNAQQAGLRALSWLARPHARIPVQQLNCKPPFTAVVRPDAFADYERNTALVAWWAHGRHLTNLAGRAAA